MFERQRRAAVLAALLLAAACAAAPGTAATPKRSFALRVQSRDFQPTFRRSLLRNTTMPLHGAVKDYGYFYATLYLGTPPKKFAVIVDTGSTMTYVPCSTCGSGCGPNHQDAAFDPEASTTASLITCGSPKCACGSPRCGCAAEQCTYQRSYAEQSSSSGILLEDVLALHDGRPGAPIIFGCETRETGEIFKQRADGLFGLGNSDASVVNQLVKAGVIDDVFSLCFGMVEGDGALLLGDAELPSTVSLQYTPLLSSTMHPFYYNVKMLSLSVAGQRLPVAQTLFDQGYGTVLDSGTTFTYMPSPAFEAFKSAVEGFALSHGLKRVPGPDPEYRDVCFGQAPLHDDVVALARVFPSMEIEFDEGTTLKLGPLNYLFVHTFHTGKYCLGVFDNGRTGTLLGGITFRNVLVRYDRGNKRVGFGPAPCKALGEMQRPPCSLFGAGGAGDLTAVAAAADGDCTAESSLRQQQETFEEEEQQLEQQQQQQQQQGGQAAQPEGQQAASGSEHQQGHGDQAHPSEQQQEDQAPHDAQQQGSGADGQQQQDTGHAPAQGVVAQGGGGGATDGSSKRPASALGVALGLVVAVVAVLSLSLAVALLQPSTRERLRGVFGSRYRSLQEEADPEDGRPAAPQRPVVAQRPSAAQFPGAVDGEVELNSASKLYRGITTPTKIQRTVSNANAETRAEEEPPGVGSATPTNRSLPS